jgi:phosphohistidine phosphatase SixA
MEPGISLRAQELASMSLSKSTFLTLAMMLSALAPALFAQSLSDESLLKALRHGGYVIVMRHAASPREVPGPEAANADNIYRERQLDASGRASAIEMGKALRELKIPIGEVLSSPTYRALETARLAQLPTPKPVPELGENGQSMAATSDAQTAWLQKNSAEFPKGTNTILITHFPNMTRAFPQWTSDLADGEALVIGPDGKGGTTLLARVKIEEWPKL